MNALFDLSGKTALVTGATGALGAHFAQVLGNAGAQLVLAGRHIDALQTLAQSLAAQGITAHPQVLDVSRPETIDGGLDAAQAQCGLIQVAVCAAGVASTQPALNLPADTWDHTLNVNLRGSWLVAQAFAGRLVAARQPGSLVLVSSILGHRVAGGVLPYTVSKAGVKQLAQALALEWARYGIRVNALAPGYLNTPLNQDFLSTEAGAALVRRIPQRRLGNLTDLDGPLLLLASDASAYMTGSSLVVDGGHLQSTL